MVLPEHTLKTGITSVITEYCIVIFKFSCQSSDYLGSSAVLHFGRKGLKDWGNQLGLRSADQKFRDLAHELIVTKKRAGFPSRGLAEQWLFSVLGSVCPARERFFQRPIDKYCLGLCVHPVLPGPMRAKKNLPSLLNLQRNSSTGKIWDSPESCRSMLWTLARGLGKPEGPGEVGSA